MAVAWKLATFRSAARSFHGSVTALRAKNKFPIVKEAPHQPEHVDWTPPPFPPEVEPAPTFWDKQGKEWQIAVAACLYRYPRITLDKTPEELEYKKFQDQVRSLVVSHRPGTY